jgi:hypothetical protein
VGTIVISLLWSVEEVIVTSQIFPNTRRPFRKWPRGPITCEVQKNSRSALYKQEYPAKPSITWGLESVDEAPLFRMD